MLIVCARQDLKSFFEWDSFLMSQVRPVLAYLSHLGTQAKSRLDFWKPIVGRGVRSGMVGACAALDRISLRNRAEWPIAIGMALTMVWATYAIAMVHFGVRDGGMGDEAHRLVIAYRLLPDLSGAINLYLSQPWPPLPYAIQVLWHRLLTLVFGISERQFIDSVLQISVLCFMFHFWIVLQACRRVGAPLAGLGYTVVVLSSSSMGELATSAMAEPYALLFLAGACWILVRSASMQAALASAALMLAASLCRSEVALFAFVVALIVAIRIGWLAGGLFLMIADAGFGFKTLYSALRAEQNLSYLNQQLFYDYGSSAAERLAAAREALGQILQQNSSAALALAFVILMLAARRLMLWHLRYTKCQADLGRPGAGTSVTAVGLCFIGLIILVSAGGIIWGGNPRYFLIPICTLVLGLCLLIGWEETSADERRFGRAVATGTSLLAVALITIAGAAGITSSLSTVSRIVPPELREARDVILARAGPKKLVVVDALLFWDSYPFAHGVIKAGAHKSAMVYDVTWLPATAGTKAALAAGESPYTVRLLQYVDAFEPALLIAAGPEWRARLNAMSHFLDREERASYIIPSIVWQNEHIGELSLSRIGSTKRFRVVRILENPKVRIYTLESIPLSSTYYPR